MAGAVEHWLVGRFRLADFLLLRSFIARTHCPTCGGTLAPPTLRMHPAYQRPPATGPPACPPKQQDAGARGRVRRGSLTLGYAHHVLWTLPRHPPTRLIVGSTITSYTFHRTMKQSSSTTSPSKSPPMSNETLSRPQCVLITRELFTKEYRTRVFHSSPCGPLFAHIEPNQLSLITRTQCTRSCKTRVTSKPCPKVYLILFDP